MDLLPIYGNKAASRDELVSVKLLNILSFMMRFYRLQQSLRGDFTEMNSSRDALYFLIEYLLTNQLY